MKLPYIKTHVKAVVCVILMIIFICTAGGIWSYRRDEKVQRTYHHKMAAGADSSLGMESIPADHRVRGSFTSHLPLIIIDTGGSEIINYKYYDPETNSFREQEGIDPYVDMTMTIVDNDNHVNTLEDPPSLITQGRIKIRGNNSSSDNFPKKQYRIRLLDENGNNADLEILGMEADSSWILNGTQRDRSYLRNYTAMNLGGSVIDYTPDMRFCEMVLKREDGYEYMGLFIMYETVKRGEGRVEIGTATENAPASYSYILRRDRFDPDAVTLNTWGSKGGVKDEGKNINISDSRLELIYPNDSDVTPQILEAITEEIDELEKALYSGDKSEFDKYKHYVDLNSFVDYFIINEIFMNYDAGEYSTYLYKDSRDKLKAGPIWDFDGAMDNHDYSLDEIKATAMQSRVWFEQMVTDPDFVNRLSVRYRELRETILSDEAIETFMDETYAFLGNAIKRDESRWKEEYVFHLSSLTEKSTKLLINRSLTDSVEERDRVKAVLFAHTEALDKLIYDFNLYQIDRSNLKSNSIIAIFILIIFFVSIILVQRSRRSG